MVDGHEQISKEPGKDAGEKWSGVEELAGKMGRLQEDGIANDDSSDSEHLELNEEQQQILEFINGLDLRDEGKEKQFIESIRQIPPELWSRNLAIEIIKTVNTYMDEEEDDAIPAELLGLGMPASIVLENQDFYDEMVQRMSRKDDPGAYYYVNYLSGTLSDFYTGMSGTEEGRRRFQSDFVESGVVQAVTEDAFGTLLMDCEKNTLTTPEVAKTISDLKTAKKIGIGLISDKLLDTYSGEKELLGQNFANILYENELLDGKEVEAIYRQALFHSEAGIAIGMLDFAISKGINAESDDPDIQYWSQLSIDSGVNAIGSFIGGEENDSIQLSQLRQRDFDFTKPPVMKLFTRIEAEQSDKLGLPEIAKYQAPEFRAALKLPEFQDIIMSAIQERKKMKSSRFGSIPPTLFLMLAQDKTVLEDMYKRGVFEEFERCKTIPGVFETVRKLDVGGGLTDEDIVSLFLRADYQDPYEEYFELDGTLTKKGIEKVLEDYGYLARQLSIKPEIAREIYNKKGYSLLSNLDEKQMSEAGFDATTQLFLKAYRYSRHADRFLMSDGVIDTDKLAKCFDENGEPTATFVEELFVQNRHHLMVKHPDLIPMLSLKKQAYINHFAGMNDHYEKLSSEEIDGCFDEEGKPTVALAEMLFTEYRAGLSGYSDLVSLLPPKEQAYMGYWKTFLFNSSRQLSREKIEECFDENGSPNATFAETLFETDRNALSHYPDLIAMLPPKEHVYMRYWQKLGNLHGSLNKEEVEEYFDEDEAKPKFWDLLISRGEFESLASLGQETLSRAGFDQASIQILGGLSGNVFDKTGNRVVNQSNILAALAMFIKMDADEWIYSDDELAVKEAFDNEETKGLALKKLRKMYEDYLNSREAPQPPRSLAIMSNLAHANGGVGPLSQIEAFLDFAGKLGDAGEDGRKWTAIIEQRMQNGHWDNQEKSNYYSISAEVIKASPELYLEFAELFANIPSKDEFRLFATEVYPLYRAKLALLKNYEDHSNGIGAGYTTTNYDSVNMEALKNQLHNALLPFNLQELDPQKRLEGIGRVRNIIFSEISELFQSKFGLLPEAIPAEFSKTDARAVEDMALYLSSIASPTEEKKDILGYFLALQFGGAKAWNALRSGAGIPPSSLLSNVVSAYSVNRAIAESLDNNPINADNTRIDDSERLMAFRRALQGETVSMRMGGVQTIDLKLQNLIGNVEELTDPDLYPDGIDRQRVDLLRRYPVKGAIGRAAATLHQRLSGREVSYAEGGQEIADAIIAIMNDNGIDVTPDNVNKYFQSGLRVVQTPFDIVKNTEESGATKAIQELQEMLTPPEEITKIFGRLGEEFQPHSGVMALAADLDFLEGLIVKKSDELNNDESELLKGYLDSIRKKMAELGTIYDGIVKRFEKMKGSISESTPGGVKEKIAEIEGIITGKDEQSVLTTTCTNEMTAIIENMRACLSAKTKGINNDTNLTFGEGYKFYLYSSGSANRSGSVADEIVYFVPTGEGDERRMSFVLDQVYGTKNSDILISHLETVLKKARALKEQFPEVPISIVLPNSSSSSCGVDMTAETLAQKMESVEGLSISEVEELQVDVPESGFGDHYIEFGNRGARAAGQRDVSGIEIVL